MSGAAVEVVDVTKTFRIHHEQNRTLKAALMRRSRGRYEDFTALDGVSLDVPEGGTFALVGNNGSGKSTLLKCMARILTPNSGTIRHHGRIAALLEVGSGFHPELSGRDNIYLNGSILGMSRKEIESRFDSIVDFSGVEQFIDQPVKNYSSGMYVRLGFSVAIHVDPDILLVDEVLAVGDAGFQEKCAERFADLRREGRTVIIVSHSLPQVRAMADQVAWLDHGKLRELGPASDVLDRYEDFSHSGLKTVLSGRVHSGSGQVRIVAAEVQGDGHEAGTAVVGERATVRLTYRTEGRVSQPVIGFAIEAMDGTYLAATNTRDARCPVEVLDGTGQIECVLPSVQLHPGNYLVTAAAVDGDGKSLDHVRDIARFTVENGGRTWSGGYLALPAAWSAPTTGPLPAGVEA